MCGIAGIVGAAAQSDLTPVLEAMKHRGPDDRGYFWEAPNKLVMGMVRLSIIDLASGQQPMPNEDESVWIVFNGEIFNAPELRTLLIAKGHTFHTDHSDTEVLVHLYEEDGPEMVSKLNGMFAFVIFDRKKQRLFGARDHVGIKPLYLVQNGDSLAFASELKCLLPLPWVGRALHGESLYHYLSLQYVPSPDSILSGVKKLPAGHSFTYELKSNKLDVNRWWSPPIQPDTGRSIDSWIPQLRDEFDRAVVRWAASDVPVACSLSGGLDSGAVAAAYVRLEKKKLATFTLGFSDDEPEAGYLNELELARTLAKHYGTEHHEIVVKSDDILTDIETMIWYLDEPYGGGLPSWYIFREIGKQYKVALTGTGGDELFGNYGKWLPYTGLKHKVRYHLNRATFRVFDPAEWLAHWRNPAGHDFHRYMSDTMKNRYWSRTAIPAAARTEARLERMWNDAGNVPVQDKVAAMDYSLQLPDEFLHMTDRFSMAHSVEARVPILDTEMMRCALQIPANQRTNPKSLKAVLRRVLEPYLPQELLTARKRGFTLPLKTWTRTKLAPRIREVLSENALKKQGLFQPRLWREVVEPHLKGERDRTQQVWTLFMFQSWCLRFFGTLNVQCR
jgi:asparagine synthase (glutamine-hydrolysing)